ncbi:DegT/DnrJ/EryC1/StrS family aminotransferase [Litorilinea aerophila]|uniref:DegT/DnrJ/EryC1/StrS family aminotransferase n=1 Tax=Litorilinea aerophila TaxID=1204385 RepID=A0A540VIC6_9CHLR|nr:DegT/DnrJ/EryC1/StrS family aminotransferase [Litorilinea aerophila]MCC9075752.1 DegT/DnrJ/EryC1/StrS family aminotransferase [Litorilinea aerophila]
MYPSPEASEHALAIHGAPPAKRRPDPPMFPGGMAIDQEEEEAVLEVLRSKRLFRYYGPGDTPSKVEALEQAFAQFMGVRYSVAVTSGTAALTCGLHGIGVGPGDEVIVPAYTWIASAAAVVSAGAIPIVAEVDDTLLLDPADVEAKITPYTRAIMPVHMRGAPCPMDEILAIARKHNLQVIEDTAQADGASYRGQRLGTFGDVGCFSLQFNKIITSGEGGMVVTNDQEVWKRALMYHDVIAPQRAGIPTEELLCGTNYRMPELLGAVGLVQLRRLDGLLAAMRARKQMIQAGMADVARRKGITFRRLTDPEGDAAIALIFFVDTPETAQRVAKALQAENIGASTLYHPDHLDYHVYAHWVPILEQRTWTPSGGPWRNARREIRYHKDMCPRSLELLGRAVHLNVSPLLTNEDVEETIEGLNRVLHALA